MPRHLIPLILLAFLVPSLSAQILINRDSVPVTLRFRDSAYSPWKTCSYDSADPAAKRLPHQIFALEIDGYIGRLFPNRPQKLIYGSYVFDADPRNLQTIPDHHRKAIIKAWLESQEYANPTFELSAPTPNRQQWTFESFDTFSSQDRTFEKVEPDYRVGDLKTEEILRILHSKPPLKGKDVALGGADKVTRFDQYRLTADAANNRWLLWHRAPDAVSTISRSAQHSALSNWFIKTYNAADAMSTGQGIYKVDQFAWRNNTLSQAQIAAQMSSYLRSKGADNPSYGSGSVTLSGYEKGWYVIKVSFEDRRSSSVQKASETISLDASGTTLTYKGEPYPLDHSCYKQLKPYTYRIGYEIR